MNFLSVTSVKVKFISTGIVPCTTEATTVIGTARDNKETNMLMNVLFVLRCRVPTPTPLTNSCSCLPTEYCQCQSCYSIPRSWHLHLTETMKVLEMLLCQLSNWSRHKQGETTILYLNVFGNYINLPYFSNFMIKKQRIPMYIGFVSCLYLTFYVGVLGWLEIVKNKK